MRKVGSTDIRIISPIQTTNIGPQVPDGKRYWQPVHLRQGSMDGACGLYSIMMALIICGVVRYDDARSFWTFTSRTPIGKLFSYFSEKGPLVAEGASLDDVHKVIDEYYPKLLDFQGFIRCKEIDMLESIEDQINQDSPVLLLMTFEDGGHWVVVIGCEYEYEHREKDKELRSLLILDPSVDAPLMCSWNGIIDARSTKGKYPFRWWTTKDPAVRVPDPINVQLSYTLAIWPI